MTAIEMKAGICRFVSSPVFWVGTVLIAIVSLSIHVVMLQLLGIAHPDFSSVGIWGLLVVVGQTFALIVVYDLARPILDDWRLPARIAFLAAIDIVATDQLRLAVMAGVTTASFAFPLITFLAGAAGTLVVAILIALTAPYLRAPVAKAGVAVAITAISAFVVQPVSNVLVAPFATLARPEIYTEPYGPGVLSISYSFFAATVAAIVLIVAIAAPRLSVRPAANLLQVAALLLLLRGTLVAQLLFPWLIHGGVAHAAIGISQFFLEDLAMAMLAWGLWMRGWAKTDQIEKP
ncbi:hypothetical protein HZF05_05335 [Sphingomonas sp. CGMCC 1.13654]|uniref:Uncharacterized protein n=1 Tax=Sphingomonas chungangi TaxID=2683589 RepID=A0A838L488_9SPHN|nr:hypothetical protein [Sphingomonas chungangi]MBA2933515.1 hypothetical protein [Sphingomonas chungangi]MVW54848.1 hypothetical protein [Sphingomonas chungangi]